MQEGVQPDETCRVQLPTVSTLLNIRTKLCEQLGNAGQSEIDK